VVMSQQSKASVEVVCENTDSESKAAAFLGKGIVEYYRRNASVDANSDLATLIALLMDTAWVFNEWDFGKGDDLTTDEGGAVLKAGDVFSRAKTPVEVIIDFTRTDTERDWVIVKDQVNKFDVAAMHPEMADEILALMPDRNQDSLFRFGEIYEWEGFESGLIDKYTFYHRRTPACPEGRMLTFFNSKLFVFSGPIPYRKLPGNRICPGEMVLSTLGFSPTNDLLALQDVMDSLISAAVTNMTSLGVNNLWVKNSANFDFEQIAEGMNLFEADEKPEVLMLNRLPPEWFSLSNFIIQRMEALSGVNSVARGNTEGKDFSGAAMALLQSMAISFNSGLQSARNKLIEDNGNDIIMLTQDFADQERLGLIVGRNNRYMMQSYKGADLKKIKRLFVRQGNPLKDTTAGKLTIAQDLIKMGSITDPGAYQEVLDTGNLDSMTEPSRNARLMVDLENDALIRGEDVPVMVTDNHPIHIAGHARVLENPEDRRDEVMVQNVTQHILEHLKVWGETPIDLLTALNIPPMQAPAAGPQGGQPPQQGGAPQEAKPGEGNAAEAPPPPQDPNVQQVNFPTDPMTGQEYQPPQGNV